MPNYTTVHGRNGWIELDKLQPELPVCAEEQKTQGASDCTPKDKVPDYSQFKLVLPDDVRLLMAKYGWTVDDKYRFKGTRGWWEEPIDLIYGSTPSVDNDNRLVVFRQAGPEYISIYVEEFDGDQFLAERVNLRTGAGFVNSHALEDAIKSLEHAEKRVEEVRRLMSDEEIPYVR